VLASLNHPHIAQIHGLEESNGAQFLMLELVDGESLDKRIARRPLPIDEALGIAKQIPEALEAAHEKGIIHRDLKPANIALTNDGQIKAPRLRVGEGRRGDRRPSSRLAAQVVEWQHRNRAMDSLVVASMYNWIMAAG
jgi:serine/threonine protein kinase